MPRPAAPNGQTHDEPAASEAASLAGRRQPDPSDRHAFSGGCRCGRRRRDDAGRMAGEPAVDSGHAAAHGERRAAAARYSRVHDAPAPGPRVRRARRFRHGFRRQGGGNARPAATATDRTGTARQDLGVPEASPVIAGAIVGRDKEVRSPEVRSVERTSRPSIFPMSNTFSGKVGLVVGVANKRSLSWAIAAAAAEGREPRADVPG